MPTLCPTCAAEVSAGRQTCLRCGAPVETPAAEVAIPAVEVVTPAAKIIVPAAEEEVRLADLPLLKLTLPDAAEDAAGIGGWLILVALRLAIAPVDYLITFCSISLPAFLQTGSRQVISSHPALLTAMAFEFITNIVILLFLVGLNILFYKEKKAFPWAFIIFNLFLIFQHGVDHLIAMLSGQYIAAHGLYQSIGLGAVWIAYIVRSKRVKNTFVN